MPARTRWQLLALTLQLTSFWPCIMFCIIIMPGIMPIIGMLSPSSSLLLLLLLTALQHSPAQTFALSHCCSLSLYTDNNSWTPHRHLQYVTSIPEKSSGLPCPWLPYGEIPTAARTWGIAGGCDCAAALDYGRVHLKTCFSAALRCKQEASSLCSLMLSHVVSLFSITWRRVLIEGLAQGSFSKWFTSRVLG